MRIGMTADHAGLEMKDQMVSALRDSGYEVVDYGPASYDADDDYPERLAGVEEIESCWSVAGDESYILKIRVATPADLEELLSRVRSIANVSTRTTIVLSTAFENRPMS